VKFQTAPGNEFKTQFSGGLLAREQRDGKMEREKLVTALDIFSELNMPRERDAVRAELEKTTAADRAT
jgi:hypothetical protein